MNYDYVSSLALRAEHRCHVCDNYTPNFLCGNCEADKQGDDL